MGYRKLFIESYFPNDEVTRYGFISHLESYIKQLLQNPLTARVDDYLENLGLDSEKALSLLLKREDESDENSSILIRSEKIRPDEKDIEMGVKTPKDKFVVKYRLPRKDYMKKMRNLYVNLFENNNRLNEDNANDYPELSKVIVKKEKEDDGEKLQFSFGKNGHGLTDELTKIGKEIERLSKNNNVYIDDVFVDSTDDVYDLTVKAMPLEEGAWGYGILQNDSALDKQSRTAVDTLSDLVIKVSRSVGDDRWGWLGVLVDTLKKYKNDEVHFGDEYTSTIMFAKRELKNLYDDEEFINRWSKPNEMKKSLKKISEELSSMVYQKEIMNNMENEEEIHHDEPMITEDGEGGAAGATSCGDSSGQYVTPLFGKPIKRTIYLTQGQVDKLKEAVEMDTAFGDFGYDAPFGDGKKNKDNEFFKDANNHKNMLKDKNLTEEESGIHINPENKGKFNATKKRTGKSTEELTHSKNPLTRKRAQFALNASKWNHKKK